MKYLRGILLLSGVLLAIYGVRDDTIWLLLAGAACLGLYAGLGRK